MSARHMTSVTRRVAWSSATVRTKQAASETTKRIYFWMWMDRGRIQASPASMLNHRLLRSEDRALRLHLSQVSGPNSISTHAFKRKEENNHWRSLNFILTALNATYKWSIMSICTPGHQHCAQHQRCATWSCNIHGHIRKKSQESRICRAKNLSFDGFLADFGCCHNFPMAAWVFGLMDMSLAVDGFVKIWDGESSGRVTFWPSYE